jgi:enoyl-CoA hydratase/carnithine racemase
MGSEDLQDLHYDVVDHVGVVTFARPDRLNAFRAGTLAEFLAVLDRVDADDEVRAVIVTGEGRAFCAGADISGGARAFEPTPARDDEPAVAPRDGGGILALRIHALQKPIIGAINGAAVGMGATMTLPMDVRLASVDARFGFPFTRRGIIPEGCSSWFLPRVVGIGTASEWMLTGRIVDAPAALAAGLVRSLHAPVDLLPAAHELAREISDNAAPVSTAMTRQLLRRMLGAEDPIDAHLAESRGLASRSRSDDAREGVESFLAKRPPAFTGRVSVDCVDMFDDAGPDPKGDRDISSGPGPRRR